jgi:hypothetical protein
MNPSAGNGHAFLFLCDFLLFFAHQGPEQYGLVRDAVPEHGSYSASKDLDDALLAVFSVPAEGQMNDSGDWAPVYAVLPVLGYMKAVQVPVLDSPEGDHFHGIWEPAWAVWSGVHKPGQNSP